MLNIVICKTVNDDKTSCRKRRPTVFTAGPLTSEQILVGFVAAVVVAVTQLAAPHADVRRRALVAARRTRRHRAVQFVAEVIVPAIVSLVTHLTEYTAQLHTFIFG